MQGICEGCRARCEPCMSKNVSDHAANTQLPTGNSFCFMGTMHTYARFTQQVCLKLPDACQALLKQASNTHSERLSLPYSHNQSSISASSVASDLSVSMRSMAVPARRVWRLMHWRAMTEKETHQQRAKNQKYCSTINMNVIHFHEWSSCCFMHAAHAWRSPRIMIAILHFVIQPTCNNMHAKPSCLKY